MADLEILFDGMDRSFPLSDGEYSIGRSKECDIAINMPRISKEHALLRVDGDRVFVKDLGSTNGTTVNANAIGSEEVELNKDSSRLRLAGILAHIVDPSRPSVAPESVILDQYAPSSKVFGPEDTYGARAGARIAELLGTLVELVAEDRSQKEVLKSACEFVGRIVDADRVFVLEDDGEATHVQVKDHWYRSPLSKDHEGAVRLSQSIVEQVLERRSSVLVSNTMDDAYYQGKDSIIQLKLASAMAAPLFDNQRVRGILYVDCSRPDTQYSADDLQVLCSVANAVAVKLRTLTLEKEMRTASRIQLSMLPSEIWTPEGWQISAHLEMCRAVGGDLYHCMRRPNGKMLVVQGDVAGKGIPASLAMAATIVLTRSINDLGMEITDFGSHLNSQLHASLSPEQFVTLFLGELDLETGVMRYLNAGHEQPRLLRHETGVVEVFESTGIPVGMLPDQSYGTREITLNLGDTLAIFSDGIPEATTTGDDFLGVEPIDEALMNLRDSTLDDVTKKILDEVNDYLAGSHASDDVTLLLLRRNAAS